MSKVTKEAFEAANSRLESEVYAPAFFDVLAHRGIVPANEKEAMDLLVLGEAARAARERQAVVEPPSRFSKLAAAVTGASTRVDPAAVIDSAAAALAKNASLADAALTVTQYTVDELLRPMTQKGA